MFLFRVTVGNMIPEVKVTSQPMTSAWQNSLDSKTDSSLLKSKL